MKLIDLDTDKEYLLDGKYKIEPIVRCKDCKWWTESPAGFCPKIDTTGFYGTDYCSFAERKEQEDER